MIIAVDFDGTCVEHEFPDVGPDVPGAVEWLRKFAEAGAQLILWTMRSDGGVRGNDRPLDDAVHWFSDRGILLWGVNQNAGQHHWTDSPKAFAHLYIDDAAFGCPLICPRKGIRPFANWALIGPAVMELLQTK